MIVVIIECLVSLGPRSWTFVEKLAWSNLSVVVNVAVKCQIKSVMFCHLVWQVML